MSVETELGLLSELERGETISQQMLSKRLRISVGLVNALLKRATKRGLVKAKAVPYRRWAYYLTPTGFAEKSGLVATYLERSLAFFRTARQEYAEMFARLKARGQARVLLAGRGELAEIALLAAREMEVEVVGLFDRETNAERIQGLPVLHDLSTVDCAGCVIITASRKPQRAYDEIRALGPTFEVLAPSFLHVAEARSLGPETRLWDEA